MRHVAVIPVKHHSERVENKNFRPFLGEKSLLDLKVEQLIKSNCYANIYISSDSSLARECAKKYNVDFIGRSPLLCSQSTSWSEVITGVISTLPINDEDVLSWCHVTSPLFQNFKNAVARFEALPENYNGLFTVSRLNRFILSSKYQPVNYVWGPGHQYSQNLEPYYFVTGSLFMGRKSELLVAKYVIPSRPFALEVSEIESIDIDTDLDFRIARWLSPLDS